MPSMTPSTRNILKVFRTATPAQVADGVEWYARARRLAEELAESTTDPDRYFADGEDWLEPDSITRAAAVIAVLSPRLSWAKNVEYARLAYAQHATGTLGDGSDLPVMYANGIKAARILNGADPEDVVGGPKVRAFWRTIADPTDPRAVVVDRHAIDVALGRVTDDATRGAILGRAGAYDTVCDLYRRAARTLTRERGELITPAQVQAVTWVAWRERSAS